MSCLPRLAVGPIHRGVDSRPVLWALLDVLDRLGLRVQTFFSRACLEEVEATTAITGAAPRHLDSWLMTAEQCRERFRRACRKSDLAVVQGCFAEDFEQDSSLGAFDEANGSCLTTLCKWLGLPRLGVIDLPALAGSELPARKPQVDALVVDQISCPCDFFRWQTILETLWGIPVIAGLESVPALRAAMSMLRSRREPPRDLCRKLGNQLLKYLAPTRLLQFACCNPSPYDDERNIRLCGHSARRSRREAAWMSPEDLTVAVAYDDAFCGYFPDVLDAMEQRGVAVQDFSPLRDESLPAGADVVYIGCGRPDLYARDLADNQCLMLALRDHVCAGKRIYAEGGGLAYLCQNVSLPTGELAPMAGILPAAARYVPVDHPPKPIELTLSDDFWLGDRGQRVRGYLNESWQLEPVGRLASCAAEPERRLDLVERHQAVGSRLHLNFALQPALLDGFLGPSAPALAWESPSQRTAALAQ
jgi:cobyrinic acid a,c-diamide synthase